MCLTSVYLTWAVTCTTDFFPYFQNLTVHIETYTSITSYTTYNVLAYTDDGHEHSTIVVCVAACCSLLNCHCSIPENAVLNIHPT